MAKWRFTRTYHGKMDAHAGQVLELDEADVAYLATRFPGLIERLEERQVYEPPQAKVGGSTRMMRPGFGADKGA